MALNIRHGKNDTIYESYYKTQGLNKKFPSDRKKIADNKSMDNEGLRGASPVNG